MSYTEGDWAVNSASRMEVNSFNGIAIADCSMSQIINTEEKAANAKLMAAAPDLLQACIDALKMYEKLQPSGGYQAVHDDLIFAIKKATE